LELVLFCRIELALFWQSSEKHCHFESENDQIECLYLNFKDGENSQYFKDHRIPNSLHFYSLIVMRTFQCSPSTCRGMIPETLYQHRLQELKDKLEEGCTPFQRDDYQGHMNFDISIAHLEALKIALPYNQNSVARESCPVTSELEKHFIRTLSEEIGYDADESWGYLSSGGTISNLQGLWIARNKARKAGRKPKYVLTSKDSHYSIVKACDILGLKVKYFEEHSRIKGKKIAAVVCTLGTTETGRIDDISFWVEYCGRSGIHCHVDAAYGGYFIYAKDSGELSEKATRAFESLHLADSIAIDPHKLGYAPYPAGVFLLKNSSDSAVIDIFHSVPYINAPSSSIYTIEGSRPGAYAAANDFGHEILKPYYPAMMTSILSSTKELKRGIENSRYFELYGKEMDLGIILFKTRGNEPPMSYLIEKFTNLSNAQAGKIQLVTTEIESTKYFRICNLVRIIRQRRSGNLRKTDGIEMFTRVFDSVGVAELSYRHTIKT
jgi:glutamate/tyrosine decarboxylase-like PLP-dependent enzyme